MFQGYLQNNSLCSHSGVCLSKRREEEELISKRPVVNASINFSSPLLFPFPAFSLWPTRSCFRWLNSIMGMTWGWAMKRWRAYRYQQNQACRAGRKSPPHAPQPSSQVITVGCNLTPFVLFVCSLTVRAGGDDGLGRLERNPSFRLPGLEHGPLEASTPQGEDLPSPLGSQSSANMVFFYFYFIACSMLV